MGPAPLGVPTPPVPGNTGVKWNGNKIILTPNDITSTNGNSSHTPGIIKKGRGGKSRPPRVWPSGKAPELATRGQVTNPPGRVRLPPLSGAIGFLPSLADYDTPSEKHPGREERRRMRHVAKDIVPPKSRVGMEQRPHSACSRRAGLA